MFLFLVMMQRLLLLPNNLSQSEVDITIHTAVGITAIIIRRPIHVSIVVGRIVEAPTEMFAGAATAVRVTLCPMAAATTVFLRTVVDIGGGGGVHVATVADCVLAPGRR